MGPVDTSTRSSPCGVRVRIAARSAGMMRVADSEGEGERGTVNLLDGIRDEEEKVVWRLSASLRQRVGLDGRGGASVNGHR